MLLGGLSHRSGLRGEGGVRLNFTVRCNTTRLRGRRNALELQGILSPHALCGVQREDGHGDPLPLADRDLGEHVPILVYEQSGEREDVVCHRDAACDRDRGVQAESFAHDEVEVRERVKLFHRGLVGGDRQELLAELLLYFWRLAERVEAPRRRRARCLVACDEEGGNLCA